MLVFGDLASNIIHVKLARRADELLKGLLREGARLRVDDDAFAHDHQRRDGPDTEPAREGLFRLGVDLGEGDVLMPLRGGLIDRAEGAAGAAPLRPEIDQHDVVPGHRGLERFLGEIGRAHVLFNLAPHVGYSEPPASGGIRTWDW